MLDRARLLIEQGRLGEAVALLRQYLADGTVDTGPGLSLLAIALSGQKHHREACETAAQALAAGPDDSLALFAHSRALRVAGQLAEAEKAIQEALRLAPEDPALWMELGVLLISRRKWEETLGAVEHGLAVSPEMTQLRALRSLALQQLRRDDERRCEVEALLRRNPEDPFVQAELGWLAFNSGNYAEAQARFLESMRIRPNDYARLGLVDTLRTCNPFYRAAASFGRLTQALARQTTPRHAAIGLLMLPVFLSLFPAMVYLSRIAEALGTISLLGQPLGRTVLTKKQTRSSLLAIGVLCLGAGLLLAGLWWAPAGMAGAALLVLPLVAMTWPKVVTADRQHAFQGSAAVVLVSAAVTVVAAVSGLPEIAGGALAVEVLTVCVVVWSGL